MILPVEFQQVVASLLEAFLQRAWLKDQLLEASFQELLQEFPDLEDASKAIEVTVTVFPSLELGLVFHLENKPKRMFELNVESNLVVLILA